MFDWIDGWMILATIVGLLFTINMLGIAAENSKKSLSGLAVSISLLGPSTLQSEEVQAPPFRLFENQTIALQVLEPECLDEVAESCFYMGQWSLAQNYRFSFEAINLPERAVIAFDRGCQLGHARSCYELAIIASDQNTGNHHDRAALLAKSCDLGYGLSCLELSRLELDGDDPVGLIEAACDLNRSLCGHLADYKLAFEGNDSNYLELHYTACDSGAAESCTTLGMFFHDKTSQAYDPFRSFNFFEQSCEVYHAQGCLLLGRQLENGEGVRQDLSRAKEMYGRACDMGDQNGCDNYARLN